MKTFNYTFSAGETKTFPSGMFFIAITASDNINVDFFKHNTRLPESAVGVQSGYFFEYEEGFDTVQVYSATSQTVKVAISQGKGGFNISSTILTGGVIDEIKPQRLVSNFTATGTLAVQTIVAPAANINGVRVDVIEFVQNGNGHAAILSKTTAPTSYTDGRILGYYFQSTTYTTTPTIEKSYIIPVGEGLYYKASAAISTASVSYEIL